MSSRMRRFRIVVRVRTSSTPAPRAIFFLGMARAIGNPYKYITHGGLGAWGQQETT